jgi:hypothetical protein
LEQLIRGGLEAIGEQVFGDGGFVYLSPGILLCIEKVVAQQNAHKE